MATKRKRLGSRANAKGRTLGQARHVRLYHWLLKSSAWRSLSLPARCLLIEVWTRYNGQNNGEIAYSVREAAKALGVGKNTAHRAFQQLEANGFLKARRRGSFHWQGGLATTWEITAEPCGDNRASKDFMSWRPENQNPVPLRGTTGPPERDREAISPPSQPLKTPPRSPGEGPLHRATVPQRETLLVYQAEPATRRVCRELTCLERRSQPALRNSEAGWSMSTIQTFASPRA